MRITSGEEDFPRAGSSGAAIAVTRMVRPRRYTSPYFVPERRLVREPGADIWAIPAERGGKGAKR